MFGMESAAPEWLYWRPGLRSFHLQAKHGEPRAAGGRAGGLSDLGTCPGVPCRALCSFLWGRKTSGPTKEWEIVTAQGSPRGPLAWVSAPGFRLPPPPSRPGFQIRKLAAPRCGSRPRPAPSPGRRSLPGVTPPPPGVGGRGPLLLPKAALAGGGSKGPRTGRPAWPAVATRSPAQARNPRAAGTGSAHGLPAFPGQLPGRGEAGARMGTRTEPTGSARGAPRRPLAPRPPPHTRSSLAAWMAASPSTPRRAQGRDAVGRGWPPGRRKGGSERTNGAGRELSRAKRGWGGGRVHPLSPPGCVFTCFLSSKFYKQVSPTLPAGEVGGRLWLRRVDRVSFPLALRPARRARGRGVGRGRALPLPARRVPLLLK